MRNIVICYDDTGNEISENLSNVLKLYRCLRKTEKTTARQLVFYDPGVASIRGRPRLRSRIAPSDGALRRSAGSIRATG